MRKFEAISAGLNKLRGTGGEKSEVFPKHARNWLHGSVKDLGNGPDSWPPPNVSVAAKPVDYVLTIFKRARPRHLYTHGDR